MQTQQFPNSSLSLIFLKQFDSIDLNSQSPWTSLSPQTSLEKIISETSRASFYGALALDSIKFIYKIHQPHQTEHLNKRPQIPSLLIPLFLTLPVPTLLIPTSLFYKLFISNSLMISKAAFTTLFLLLLLGFAALCSAQPDPADCRIFFWKAGSYDSVYYDGTNNVAPFTGWNTLDLNEPWAQQFTLSSANFAEAENCDLCTLTVYKFFQWKK